MANRPKSRHERASKEQGKHHHMYGARWRAARLRHLAEFPLCVQCEAEGRVTAATDVDHIEPHRGDVYKFWDATNWQSLCSEHHKAKTARGE